MAIRAWKARRASTRFVRVPTHYWAELQQGVRREFRVFEKQATRPGSLISPSVIVAWRELGGSYEAKLMVLEAVWEERLGEISQASLEAEGHYGADGFAHFRREWSERTHRPFDLLRKVWVMRMHPLHDADEDEFSKLAFVHLAHLYADHLSDGARARAEAIHREYARDLGPA